MRIGINGRFLMAKRTGVQRAAYNLMKTLFEIDRHNEYFLFTGDSQKGLSEWSWENVTIVTSPIREGDSLRNHLWEQFQLPRLASRYGIDLLHSPANLAPFFYSGPSIVHIHDLCFIVNPQWYSYAFHRAYNFIIPRLARKATKVITNSNNSRNDLMQFCEVSADKVKLIYWAVDATFHRVSSKKEGFIHDNVPKEDFILYVGSLEPRKNIATLIEAYESLRHRNPQLKTKLILIGGENRLFAKARLKISEYDNDIHFKGFVGDEKLRDYYRKATVVAYPSLYEGFGLPPLEAMASGTPVVTSNTSSLPEVVGDAALMVSPFDASQLAEALEKVLSNSALRQKMVASGYKQVKKFNWYRVARNILGVYYETYAANSSKAAGDAFLPYEQWQSTIKTEKSFLLGKNASCQ